MLCTKCKGQILEDDKFCAFCGTKVTKAAKEKEDIKKFCDQCGKKISKDNKFCSSCGNEI